MPKTWKIWKWFPPLQKLKTVSIGYQSTVKTPQIEICWEGGSGGSLCEEVSFGPLSGYTFVPLYLESIPPGQQPGILSLCLYLWKVSPLVHSLVSYHYTYLYLWKVSPLVHSKLGPGEHLLHPVQDIYTRISPLSLCDFNTLHCKD